MFFYNLFIMTKLKEFIQLEGENVLTQIEGNAYNADPNPIAQLVASIAKIFWVIFGIKWVTYVIVTNLRIVQVEKKTILWGILPGATNVLTLNKATIQSVGYAMASRWFIFRQYYFLLANASGTLRITYKGSGDALAKACQIVDSVVTQK